METSASIADFAVSIPHEGMQKYATLMILVVDAGTLVNRLRPGKTKI